jgi:hypothetical protein
LYFVGHFVKPPCTKGLLKTNSQSHRFPEVSRHDKPDKWRDDIILVMMGCILRRILGVKRESWQPQAKSKSPLTGSDIGGLAGGSPVMADSSAQ